MKANVVESGILRSFSWLLAGCMYACHSPDFYTVERTQMMMDTVVSLKLFLPDGEREAQGLAVIDSVFVELARIDSLMSSYSATSEIAALNRSTGDNLPGDFLASKQCRELAISAEIDSVIRAAYYVSSCSNGAFDITIAPVLHLWGFGTDSLKVPSVDQVTSRLPLVNFHHLRLRQVSTLSALSSTDIHKPRSVLLGFAQPGMMVDLGGIAKGYAADLAERILTRHGYRDFLVAAGGDLRMRASALTTGRRFIWIKHPRRPDAFFARFRLDEGAVSTSGDYERFFEIDGKRYHHLLDPSTGFPAGRQVDGSQIVSATVVTQKTIYSDAFATALFVLGAQAGIALAERLPNLEAVIVFIKDGRLEWRATQGLEKKLEVIDAEL